MALFFHCTYRGHSVCFRETGSGCWLVFISIYKWYDTRYTTDVLRILTYLRARLTLTTVNECKWIESECRQIGTANLNTLPLRIHSVHSLKISIALFRICFSFNGIHLVCYYQQLLKRLSIYIKCLLLKSLTYMFCSCLCSLMKLQTHQQCGQLEHRMYPDISNHSQRQTKTNHEQCKPC